MKNLFLFILLFASFFATAQDTTVDSSAQKVEKFYNTELSDSAREAIKAQIEHMDKYIAQDSTRADAYVQRGFYYGQLGLMVQAIEDYDRAIALDDSLAIAYFNRSLALARFRWTMEACMDMKMAQILGLDQAQAVVDANCVLYKRTINKILAASDSTAVH